MIRQILKLIARTFKSTTGPKPTFGKQESVDLSSARGVFVGTPEPKVGVTQAAFEGAANRLGVEPAKIRAVDDVESRGQGFLSDGRPKVLFEAHWFARFTDGQYNDSHPNISSPRWNRSLYKGGSAEHDRIQKAMELDRKAALKSASWGRFQIMGFNWRKCKYDSLQRFIDGMFASESEHLRAFVRFLESEGLDEPLRQGDWRAFARGYNGPGYAENNYHTRMKDAYETYR